MPIVLGKRELIVLGVCAALGALTLYKLWPRQMNFKDFKLLDKASLLKVLKEIRVCFSEQFSPLLRINRTKRRLQVRGGKEYVSLIKDLKNQANNILNRSFEKVLGKYDVSEDVFSKSINLLENDQEIKSSITKICGIIETNPSPLLTREKLDQILSFYIKRARQFDDDDPNNLNIKMKMLEDELVQEFGFEPEEIEAAASKYEGDLKPVINSAKDMHDRLRENTYGYLF